MLARRDRSVEIASGKIHPLHYGGEGRRIRREPPARGVVAKGGISENGFGAMKREGALAQKRQPPGGGACGKNPRQKLPSPETHHGHPPACQAGRPPTHTYM